MLRITTRDLVSAATTLPIHEDERLLSDARLVVCEGLIPLLGLQTLEPILSDLRRHFIPISAAPVPGRGEYLKLKLSMRPARATKSRVS